MADYHEQTASPELCEKLSKLTDWNNTYYNYWRSAISKGEWRKSYRGAVETREVKERIPAYTAGYLLRKIEHLYPQVFRQIKGVISEHDVWCAFPRENDGLFTCFGNSPEDALADLCIKLIEERALDEPGRPDVPDSSQSLDRRASAFSDKDANSYRGTSANNSGSIRNINS